MAAQTRKHLTDGTNDAGLALAMCGAWRRPLAVNELPALRAVALLVLEVEAARARVRVDDRERGRGETVGGGFREV